MEARRLTKHNLELEWINEPLVDDPGYPYLHIKNIGKMMSVHGINEHKRETLNITCKLKLIKRRTNSRQLNSFQYKKQQ